MESSQLSFSERLRQLIGQDSVSSFARRVNLTESLIRKYLSGSEPSLSRALQISLRAPCSLEWLASGMEHSSVTLDTSNSKAINLATQIAINCSNPNDTTVDNQQLVQLIFKIYLAIIDANNKGKYLDQAQLHQLANQWISDVQTL